MIDDRKRRHFGRLVGAAAAATLLMLVGAAAAADHRYPVDNATYRQECGSCHVAYPPALLGAGSWREIMRGLDCHFGTDASVSEPARAQITAYLEAGAGRSRAESPTLRISEMAWFRKEHREVSAATWKSPAVKSAANCGACHRQAEQGDFSERTLVVPGRGSR